MRIISGKHRGATIISPNGDSIRPTTDSTKEAIFSMLSAKPNQKVLDLFGGSGAMGLECISRYQSDVVFADKDNAAIALIKQNLANIKEKANIIHADYVKTIDLTYKSQESYDIIFLDPPYDAKLESDILRRIYDTKILKTEGVIVLERDLSTTYDLPEGYAVTTTKRYGKTEIDLIEYRTKAALTGSFDPFTNGHLYLLKKALEKFAFVYIVLLINPEKVAKYSIKTRMSFVEKATKEYRKSIKIEYYDGLTIDYCKKNGIRTIVRGIRDEKDLIYEQTIAAFNLENGGIKTIFIEAEDKNISSSVVRNNASDKDIIASMVPNSILKKL